MRNRILIANTLDRHLARDLSFLYIATCFVFVQLFGYNWSQALIAAPIGMLGFCMAIYLFVQASWLIMVGIDRLIMRLGSNQKRL